MSKSVVTRCASAVFGISLVAGLTGCATPSNLAGTGDATVVETRTEVVTETSAETSAPDASAIPEVPGGTDAIFAERWGSATQTHEPSGPEDLVVEDIQVGTHDGFDRVVFVMTGENWPGYTAEFVDQAVQDGSGFVHDTGDDKVLLLRLNGMAMPMDVPRASEFTGSPVIGGGNVVNQVIYDNWFEGEVRSFITIKPSVADPVFAVSLLDHPTRVVVDVAPGASVGH